MGADIFKMAVLRSLGNVSPASFTLLHKALPFVFSQTNFFVFHVILHYMPEMLSLPWSMFNFIKFWGFFPHDIVYAIIHIYFFCSLQCPGSSALVLSKWYSPYPLVLSLLHFKTKYFWHDISVNVLFITSYANYVTSIVILSTMSSLHLPLWC